MVITWPSARRPRRVLPSITLMACLSIKFDLCQRLLLMYTLYGQIGAEYVQRGQAEGREPVYLFVPRRREGKNGECQSTLSDNFTHGGGRSLRSVQLAAEINPSVAPRLYPC